MIHRRTGVFTEPDHHHLEQAALDLADKARMRLDAADDGNVIRPVRLAVEVDWDTILGGCDCIHLHGRSNRSPGELLGDAIALDYLTLPLGRAGPMSTHGR